MQSTSPKWRIYNRINFNILENILEQNLRYSHISKIFGFVQNDHPTMDLINSFTVEN